MWQEDYHWLATQPFPLEVEWIKQHPTDGQWMRHDACGQNHYRDQACYGYGTTLIRDMPAPYQTPKKQPNGDALK